MGRQEYKRNKRNDFAENRSKNWGGSNNTHLMNERARRKAAAEVNLTHWQELKDAREAEKKEVK